MIAEIRYSKQALQCKIVSCFVFLLMCSHGRTLQRPRETYFLYIYIYGERDKGRKETERRRDTETNMERGKGLHHIIATM